MSPVDIMYVTIQGEYAQESKNKRTLWKRDEVLNVSQALS